MREASENPESLADVPLTDLILNLQNEGLEGDSSRAAIEILHRFQPLLRKYFRRVCLTGEYEDFMQEVILRLLLALPRLKDPRAFPGLLRRITIGVASDFYEKRPRADLGDLPELEQFASDFDDSVSGAVVARSLLELLPSREREILDLLYFKELKVSEASKRTGLSAGAVRMTRSRAVHRLRKLINNQKK